MVTSAHKLPGHQMTNRGQQLMLLRRAQLPSLGEVSPGVLKAVLRCVDDHGEECWASIATIAEETQFCERTVRKALGILVANGYLIATKRPGQTSSFCIRWDVLTPARDAGVASAEPRHLNPQPRHLNPLTPASDSTNPGIRCLQNEKKRNRNEKKRHICADKSAVSDSELLEWIEFWNSLKAKNLVSSGASTKPSKGIQAGWKRVKRSAELRELLSDKPAIETAIRKSEFVRGSWFRLEKLFGGTNRDGEFVVQKLLDGGYASSSNGKQRYSATYNPADSEVDHGF